MSSIATEQLAAAAAATGKDAAAEACEEAVARLGTEPGLMLAFSTGDIDQAAAGEALGSCGTPNALGMSGKGAFAVTGPVEDGAVAVAFDRSIDSGIGLSREAGEDLRLAGRVATELALAQVDPASGHPLLLLFVDSRAGDLAEAIAGAYEVSGPSIPIAGGAAAGAEQVQYVAGEAIENSVIAAAIVSPNPIGVGCSQTGSARGVPSIVTRSEGQIIWEIDGRPAEDVYLEQLGAGGQSMDDDEFASLAITRPLAQPELHGEVRLRHVTGRAPGKGLRCATHIPANAGIEFAELTMDELIRSGWESVSSSLSPLGSGSPRAALVFDCAGRRRVLADRQDDEVAAIIDSFGGDPPPMAGLYTSGEVARLRGAKGDHNHAVVTVSFA